VCNIINKCGSEVEFIPGGYTRCLYIMDTRVNKPFKGYLREEFDWWMMKNGSRRQRMRADISQWIDHAWSKVTRETIVNTWNSVVHKAGDLDNKDSDVSSVMGVRGSNSGIVTNQ
jgi:hypothetical protein